MGVSLLYVFSQTVGAWLLFTVCCLDSTSVRKSRCGQLMLSGAFCILNMPGSRAHVSPWSCTCDVSFTIFTFLCVKLKSAFLQKIANFQNTV